MQKVIETAYTRPKGSRAIHRHVLLLQAWWEERLHRGVGIYAAQHGWVLDSSMRAHHRLPPEPWVGDGIIAHCGKSRLDSDIVDFALRSRLPVVETQITEWLPGAGRVTLCHSKIGQMGAEHLLSLNFRDLGFVSFEDNALELARRKAFREAAEAAGARFHYLNYANLVSQLASLPRPMALMASNDANAVNVLLALSDAGRRVPEEYAILGADDAEIVCDLALVPLSSVNCNYEQQGYEAAALLDKMMNGEAAPREAIIINPAGITVRRSTDAIALSDVDSARFLRYLRDNYLEHETLSSMAHKIGVSLRKVQMIFRKELGHGLLDELIRLRVEHSKKLLTDSEMKIETVATESGFTSRFHFIRAFNRVTGMTPKRYRLNAKEAAQDSVRSPAMKL